MKSTAFKHEPENTCIVRYELAGDAGGLLAYFDDGVFYHVHSNEMTLLEKWIRKCLLRVDNG